MLLRSNRRPKPAIIDCPVRVVVLNERTARSLAFLLDFSCGRGVRTSDDRRAIWEVHEVLRSVYQGRDVPTRIVVPYDEYECPISIAVVSLRGDGKLTREPYIETIARHNDFYRSVIRDRSTTAGGVALRGVLDFLASRYGSDRLPSVSARVLEANHRSHRLFAEYGFDALPQSITRTEQVIRSRAAHLPLTPLPLESAYIPPSRKDALLPAFALTRRIGQSRPCRTKRVRRNSFAP